MGVAKPLFTCIKTNVVDTQRWVNKGSDKS